TRSKRDWSSDVCSSDLLFTEIRYVYEAPTATFDKKFERLIINPGVSKKILRDESLKISFLVNDLLNQNVGFRRSQNGNVFTQNRSEERRVGKECREGRA